MIVETKKIDITPVLYVIVMIVMFTIGTLL